VGKHVTIQRVQSGVVDVGNEHPFTQIVEHDNAGDATKSAEGALVEFSPDPRAGAEDEQTNCFAAAAQGHYEQSGASILASFGIAHHRAATVIDLRFLAGRSGNHYAGFGRLSAT
jgi:hypothetical protein